MNNQNFAELKDKLTTFDEQAVSQYIGRHLDKFGDEPTYGEVAQSVHFRNVEIITQLLEIIQSQSEALRLAPRYDDDGLERHSFIKAQQALSETNTRLQKLRNKENDQMS